jgi:hypothetical protein
MVIITLATVLYPNCLWSTGNNPLSLTLIFLFPQINTDRNVSAFPEGESLFKWIGTISGPKGTVSSSDKCNVIIKGCGHIGNNQSCIVLTWRHIKVKLG